MANLVWHGEHSNQKEITFAGVNINGETEL